MRFNSSVAKIVAPVALLLVVISSAHATHVPVRGSSGYGPGPNSDASVDFSTCADGSHSSCEAFNLTSIGTATLNGSINFNVFQFAFNQNGSGPQVFDIVDLGSIAANTTFTLSSSLFDAANAEVFSCGGAGKFVVTDSSSPPAIVNGPCTPDLTGSPLDFANGQFTLTQTLSGDLVLDISPAATPEPASLLLLGSGLLALSGKLVRRRMRRTT